MNSEKRPFDPENDADISLLLYKMGHALKQFILWIGSFFVVIWNAILASVIFIMRNILWLVAGTLIGLGYGYFKFSKTGTQYTSRMIVKTNFGSTAALYNSIEYINALISSGRAAELAELFKITTQESQQLIGFAVKPVKSEQIEAQMYRDEFLKFDRAMQGRHDTFWLRTFRYDEFKTSLTQENYPFHEIDVSSYNATIYSKLKQGLIDYISSNKLLKEVREQHVISNKEEEKVIASAIQNLDSLRAAYNVRLEKGQPTSTVGNQLTILEEKPGNFSVPELDLYDKILELQDRLKISRKTSVEENNIIDVYADFSPVGRPNVFFKHSGQQSAVIGFSVALFIILFIAVYKAFIRQKTINKRPAAVDTPN